MPPYIGVTGFMSPEEVLAVRGVMGATPTRRLMVGVLASAKTLRGQTNKWPNRYPTMERIASIFFSYPRLLNLIHYATDDQDTLADQLQQLEVWTGTSHDGYQLNMCWPHPEIVAHAARNAQRIVLQIGGRALAEADNSACKVASKLDEYQGIITDILIDPSGGKGIPFDPDLAEAYLTAISERHPKLGLGIAGGLSPETLSSIASLARMFPNLSIDAEGRLRTPMPEDKLDVARAQDYVRRATELFSLAE